MWLKLQRVIMVLPLVAIGVVFCGCGGDKSQNNPAEDQLAFDKADNQAEDTSKNH